MVLDMVQEELMVHGLQTAPRKQAWLYQVLSGPYSASSEGARGWLWAWQSKYRYRRGMRTRNAALYKLGGPCCGCLKTIKSPTIWDIYIRTPDF